MFKLGLIGVGACALAVFSGPPKASAADLGYDPLAERPNGYDQKYAGADTPKIETYEKHETYEPFDRSDRYYDYDRSYKDDPVGDGKYKDYGSYKDYGKKYFEGQTYKEYGKDYSYEEKYKRYRKPYGKPRLDKHAYSDHRHSDHRKDCDDIRDIPKVHRSAYCVRPARIYFRLKNSGWHDFHGLRVRPHVFKVKARYDDGRLYRLQIDRCSGDIISAKLQWPRSTRRHLW